MKKVLIIVGPTGAGKSEFSIELAKRFNGSIISGDSIQVYKGLNIGSAKITEKEMQNIDHYGIDILENTDNYSVADFQKLARNYIDIIIKQNKLPMIVGGTGLYIKACLYDYNFIKQETNEVEDDYDTKTNEELYSLLEEVDFESTKKIHINNRKRVIRALRLKNLGKSKSELESLQKKELIYDAFIVGCSMPRDLLYERINQRVIKMIELGLEKEIKSLLDSGINFDNQSMQGIGYKEWKEYFEGNIDINEVIRLIQRNSRSFAKRQYTWFNNQMEVNWINMLDDKEIEYISTRIEQWIKD
ncbi:MAG: tRNA (adenosine(37)-N6)-dimethylallyltransferase MiaA [Erysipelotrichaceae bacterium]|nr:tRNA (adenosine(37)-N6)-dimethylallyltransferase MiaA [Erysipelotrichaceae bacterium]